MKNFALIVLIAVAFASCKSVKSQQVSNANLKTETNSTKVEIVPIQENLLKDLTKKQKQGLDESLPPKVREILDKSDEINIYYNIDKETKGFRVLLYETVPNSGAILSDAALKKQFLESFYYDVALGRGELSGGGAMCFSPRHKITAKYNNKIVDIDICYQCSNFKGSVSSNGNVSGGLNYESKSAAILSKIIEKYGTELQQDGN